jgi:hypothetical protein
VSASCCSSTPRVLDFGYASALAWVIFAILLSLTVPFWLSRGVAGAVMSYLTKRVIGRSISVLSRCTPRSSAWPGARY